MNMDISTFSLSLKEFCTMRRKREGSSIEFSSDMSMNPPAGAPIKAIDATSFNVHADNKAIRENEDGNDQNSSLHYIILS